MDAGLRVRSLNMAGDPDTFIRQNGAEAYRAELEDSKPLVEWLGEYARAASGLDKPEVYPGENGYKHVDALKMVMGHLEQVPEDQREQISAELRRHLGVKVEDVAEVKKTHSEHISAWDLTFAPDKSYSVTALVGGDAGIVADHKAAVRIAMDAGEEYAMARMGGDNPAATTSNWVSALFLHDTARPVENASPNPHLHTHGVVFNMTQASDKIRSMTAREIYRVQSFETAVYQSEMAHRAMSRGYELEHGKNFSTRIQGYSAEYLLAMSARSESINKEKAEKGLVGAEADERVNKRLREAKQSWIPEELKAEHRRQATEMGQDPAAVVAAAKERRAIMLSDQQRAKVADEAIAYAKDRLQANQAVNDRFEILRDSLRYGLGRIRLPDVKEALDRQIAKGEFVEVQHYRQGAPGARYTTPAMRELETETIQMVLAGQGKTKPIAPDLTRDEFRDRYKYFMVDGKRKEMNNKQLWMGYNVLTSPNQYMIVLGAAGVGKSKAMTPIAELADHQHSLREIFFQHGRAGYEPHGLASTSKAAENLRDLGIKSETLQAHNYRGVDPKAQKRLYILDEGSLVGAQDFRKFVGTVRPIDRVVIAGDLRQHQSVQAGRIVEELEQAGVATFRLEQIVRQKETPELLRVMENLRVGKHLEALGDMKEQGRIHEIPDRNARLQYMAMWYLRDPDNTFMVAPDNRTIGDLNAAARVELRKAGKLGPDVYEGRILTGVRDVREADRKRAIFYEPGNVIRWGKGVGALGVQSGEYTPVVRVDAAANHVTIQVGSREVTYNPRNAYGVEIYETRERQFAVGERIQITRPWRVSKDVRIANRSMGTIREIDQNGNASLEMSDGRIVKWNAKDMRHINYSYAMTSYSLQYATAKRALLHLDVGDSRIRTLMDKSLVYVGLSRGSHDMQVFTDDEKVLLSPTSPVLRESLKPKALSKNEIVAIGMNAA
jgi:conjugative relaxase-like TrwC/TraI family protein